MKPSLQGETGRTWAIINTWQKKEERKEWHQKIEMNVNMVLEDDTVMQQEGKCRWGSKALNDMTGRVVKSFLSPIV